MATGAEAHAIRLKLGDKRLQDAGAAGAVKRAFRLACARAAVEFSDLNMMVTDLQQQEVPLELLLSGLAGAPAIMVLEGPSDTLGVAVIDKNVMAGLLEHVTTGRISSGEPAERRPTKTDIAILADFLDRALEAMATELDEVPNQTMIKGFRYSRILYEPRAVEMILENINYSQFQLGLDLGEGAKSGVIALSFPASGGPGLRRSGKVRSWSECWREQVDLVPVKVEAILDRPKMRLRDVADLEVGRLIELPSERIEQVCLVGSNGKIVARGKLGRQGPCRALRVESIGPQKRKATDTAPRDAVFEQPNMGGDAMAAPPMMSPSDGGLPPLPEADNPIGAGVPDMAPAAAPAFAPPEPGPLPTTPMAEPMPMASPMAVQPAPLDLGNGTGMEPAPMAIKIE